MRHVELGKSLLKRSFVSMPTTFCTPSQSTPHFLCENLLAVIRQILADAQASSKLRQCTLLDPLVLQKMDCLL